LRHFKQLDFLTDKEMRRPSTIRGRTPSVLKALADERGKAVFFPDWQAR
jgi:hypothetical protein